MLKLPLYYDITNMNIHSRDGKVQEGGGRGLMPIPEEWEGSYAYKPTHAYMGMNIPLTLQKQVAQPFPLAGRLFKI